MTFPSGWHRKTPIEIKSLTYVDSNLTDYILSVTHDSLPSEIWSGVHKALNDGGDLRASSDSAGSVPLNLNVIRWDQTNQKALLEIRVPTVNSASNTTVYLWYSKSEESQPARTDATYGSDGVYHSDVVGAWPLNQDTGGNALDQTSNQNDGTRIAGPQSFDFETSAQSNPNIPFLGQYLDGSDDRFNLGDDSSLQAVYNEPWCITLILNMNGTGSTQSIVSRRGTGSDYEGWETMMQDSGDYLRYMLDNGTNDIYADGATNLTDDDTHHIAFIYDGSTNGTGISIYIDSVDDTSVQGNTGLTALTNTNDAALGARKGNASDRDLNGRMAQVKIFKNEISAAWVKAEYNMYFNASLFSVPQTSVNVGNIFPDDYTLVAALTSQKKILPSSQSDFSCLVKTEQLNHKSVIRNGGLWANITGSGGAPGMVRMSSDEAGTTEIPIEVERLTSGEGDDEAAIWFKTNLSAGGGDTAFLWVVDDEDETPRIKDSTYGQFNVWPNFADVKHFNETGNGTTGEYKDSTSNENHATGGGGDAAKVPSRVSGIVDGGQQGDGTNDFIQNTQAVNYPVGSSARTIEIFAKLSDGASEDPFVGYGKDDAGERITLAQRSYGIGIAFSFHFWGDTQIRTGWTHVLATFDGVGNRTDSFEVYIDGLRVSESNLSGSNQTLNTDIGNTGRFMANLLFSTYMNKAIDEYRLHTVYRSADWVYTNSKMIKDPSDLWIPQEGTPNLKGNFNENFLGGFQ